jgi:hypothetical protein
LYAIALQHNGVQQPHFPLLAAFFCSLSDSP